MIKNKGQYLGTAHSADTEFEIREVKLTSETWKKLDELAKELGSRNHQNAETYAAWALEFFLSLCASKEGFGRGIIPDGFRD